METKVNKNENAIRILQKVMFFFGLMWLVSGVGLIFGQYVPSSLLIPLIIVELGLVIAVVFARKSKAVGKFLALLFALVSGIVLYSSISYYVGELGGQLVLTVFLTTAIVFAIYGIIGFNLKKDLAGWGSYLFIALIVLVVLMVVNMIFPMRETWMLVASGFGVLLFSFYTIYDFNSLRHRQLSVDDVPSLALNLYLDFLNLFLDLLRIVNYFKN
ncbi:MULTISPECIES: Bax inhibitor-1/YccA family protein [unclassified Psychrobacillus]|uniref:Bax inhibitor-1/YccA family protein n=1 Tax=unclassified Psychrobacillus TaxID=2636677 RepID=UPI0030F4C84E